VKFTTKNGTLHSLSFEYASKLHTEVPKIKFLGLCIDYLRNWKSYRKDYSQAEFCLLCHQETLIL
jgi:hypothetical protein